MVFYPLPYSHYPVPFSWRYPGINKTGINSLVIAIVLGITYSNTLSHRLPHEWGPGIQFSVKQLLRLAIILYGFRITFQQMMAVDITGLIIDILVVSLTLILGTWIGMKLFKLNTATWHY